MRLEYAVHLDDYHSNREVEVPSKAEAVGTIISWMVDGYDVDRIKLDGQPFDWRQYVEEAKQENARLLAQYPTGTWAGD